MKIAGIIRLTLLLLTTLTSVTAAAADTTPPYADQIRDWRAKRVERLRSDTGWLTVAGLFWLEPGVNTFGTDADNAIVLPAGSAAAHAGVFEHATDGTTTIRGAADSHLRAAGQPIESLRMRDDTRDTTDVVELGRLRFFVIKRAGRYAIRMRDLESPMRLEFHGIDAWPVDPKSRVEARFKPNTPAKMIPIANIIGSVDSMICPGTLTFKWGGKSYTIDPVLESPTETELFIIFRDATSGDETYGGGRFLYADMPKDGKTFLDFNKAYNPPCAFTAFATCPLPPRQNELPVAIRAGEKKYGDH